MQKRILRRAQQPHTLTTLPLLLQRIYAARNIKTAADIDRSLAALLPYQSLQDIDKATARLVKAILHDEKILIIGDFDGDGATATALAVSA